MERVFLSYTYKPHPQYAVEAERLQITARRIIESMGLQVIDGVHLGGRALDSEIEARIANCDALVALYMPQADKDGREDDPIFVMTEFWYARGLNKPRIRVMHERLLPPRGLGAGEQYVPYSTATALDAAMEVLQTLALWKRELGRSVQIRVEPDDLAKRFKPATDTCKYQLMIGPNQRPASPTLLWHEPGGAFVHVPNLLDGAKVQVSLTVGKEEWQSSFDTPQMGGIKLQKATP